jgi:broad specificity phosphatase PhoE
MIPFFRLRSAIPVLLLLALAAPAAALDTLYIVRHAEKADPWPADLDAFRPLAPAGEARAETLANRLKDVGIAAVYTSRTTRTMATAMPLVNRAHIPLVANDASTHPNEMAAFLAGLRERHAHDRAALIVGHANTIPELLVRLGATPDCYARLGIVKKASGLEIEGYEGMWTVDLKKQGCAAILSE